ncbi:hypothetical protein ACFW1M_28905 [Streptomyces inhibens]|uniref:hypothetical protein n=1 Tax=Streptomyces inhibens TaxID=2293571 RepID=UPI0036A340CB
MAAVATTAGVLVLALNRAGTSTELNASTLIKQLLDSMLADDPASSDAAEHPSEWRLSPIRCGRRKRGTRTRRSHQQR